MEKSRQTKCDCEVKEDKKKTKICSENLTAHALGYIIMLRQVFLMWLESGEPKSTAQILHPVHTAVFYAGHKDGNLVRNVTSLPTSELPVTNQLSCSLRILPFNIIF